MPRGELATGVPRDSRFANDSRRRFRRPIARANWQSTRMFPTLGRRTKSPRGGSQTGSQRRLRQRTKRRRVSRCTHPSIVAVGSTAIGRVALRRCPAASAIEPTRRRRTHFSGEGRSKVDRQAVPSRVAVRPARAGDTMVRWRCGRAYLKPTQRTRRLRNRMNPA